MKKVLLILGSIVGSLIVLLLVSSMFINQRFIPDSSTLLSILLVLYLIFSVTFIITKERKYFKEGETKKAWAGLISLGALFLLLLPMFQSEAVLIAIPLLIFLSFPVFLIGIFVGRLIEKFSKK